MIDGKSCVGGKEIGNDQNCQESIDILALLKACAKQKDLQKGTRVHADILKRGLLQKNCYVTRNLLTMYVKCGAFAKAAQVLDGLSVRNVVSWNMLITGYAQNGQGEEVLSCVEQMEHEGLCPNAVTFIGILKACGSLGAVDKGKQIHDAIARQGLLGKHLLLDTSLVDMYAKCGALEKAAQVLFELPVSDVVSWSSLIAGYAQQGQGEEALKCFDRMQQEGVSPNTVTFICLLKACGSIRAAGKGEQIHSQIVRQGLLDNDVVLGNTLVDMYAKCGALAKAARLLDELPIRNVVSWNALIAGYVQQGQGKEALNCFERMQLGGLSPNAVTYICTLRACGSIRAIDKGEQIHDAIVQQRLLEKNTMLGNTLVAMYAKCGALAKAAEVLDKLPVCDIVSWSALIAGYSQQGQGEEALKCFERMQSDGLSPDTVTFICILKACGSMGTADMGERFHNEIIRQGLLGKNNALGNTLVDMYAKCGALAKAARVLDELPVRDAVSWSALIAGYTQQGQGEEALKCFGQMQNDGLSPDSVTFLCILKACSSIGATDKGEQIHDAIVRQGLLGKDIMLGTTLVDMYAKCGAVSKAAGVLEELSARNVVTWNALIAGYAQEGQGEEALKCFDQMQNEGVSPDKVTLASVLNACSRSGLLDAGQICFTDMSKKYGISADIEHHICMADLFGRAGKFDKALAVIQKMATSDFLPVWRGLLGACRECGNLKLGKLAFDNAVQLDENDGAAYVLMANIYAAAGMHKDAINIEAMRKLKHKRM